MSTATSWHSILARQIRKHLGDAAEVPPEYARLLAAVDEVYRQFDEELGRASCRERV